MKVLVVGPSITCSCGGMVTVINNIRDSKIINEDFDVDLHASYIDGNILMRLAYSLYGIILFLFRVRKYDLIHIHVASFGSTFRKIWYQKIAKKYNKKTILHVHGAKYKDFYLHLTERKKKKVLDFFDQTDMVIALSDGWKHLFEEMLNVKNCEVLNNGIDDEAYAVAVNDVEQYRNNFVMLGRLGQRKGTYDLIDAVECAVLKNPDIKVFMAGDGEVEKVKKIVEEKNLEKNIEIVGWVDFKGKIELLKKSATFVLPSYNEGLPMAILESMAAGKAIISTTVGAIPEVIEDENGILIQPGDIQALANALIKCSSDPVMLRSMSEHNISIVKEQYSLTVMHNQLISYYQKVFN